MKIGDINPLSDADNRDVSSGIWREKLNDHNVKKFKSFYIQQVYHGANPLTYCDLQVRHAGLSCDFAEFSTHMAQARASC